MQTNIDSVVENLMSLQPLLYKNFIKTAKRSSPMTPGALFVMSVLKRCGMCPMSEIGRRLSMPKPHVTTHVDKLIAEGMVERMSDPKDRRIINIRITERGIQHIEEIKKEISEGLRTRLETLEKNTIEELQKASQKVREILTQLNDVGEGMCVKSHDMNCQK